MKLKALEDVIRNTPVFVPVFRVNSVPNWAKDYVTVGEELYFNAMKCSFVQKNGNLIWLGASYVDFVEYQKL